MPCKTKCSCKLPRKLARLWIFIVALSLMAVAFGCAQKKGLGKSSYRVQIPELSAPPKYIPCTIKKVKQQCAVITEADLSALVLELKSACLAHGGDKKQCQIK
ncbi:hypothetical protein [uncultured Mediterranean phage uvDeep-CGR2-AD3-C191]|nr:hypothetical protein [uncultured Mediterranean phage uvDeep-CGR2-AD3-C191]